MRDFGIFEFKLNKHSTNLTNHSHQNTIFSFSLFQSFFLFPPPSFKSFVLVRYYFYSYFFALKTAKHSPLFPSKSLFSSFLQSFFHSILILTIIILFTNLDASQSSIFIQTQQIQIPFHQKEENLSFSFKNRTIFFNLRY